MTLTVKKTVLLCLIAASCLPAYGSDIARERRMADEIVDAIIDGDAVFLSADNREFLGIYTQADEAKGIAVILHGRGLHPDWQDAINPMRVGLAEAGWDTLSVQMPVLEKQAKYYDYIPVFDEAIPRINASIKFAGEKSNKKIILIAHSCGAHMAMSWVDSSPAIKIDAYVGIGMGATDYQQPMWGEFPLDKIKVPVLDVYAEGDYPAVIRMAPERLEMMTRAGNKKSRQVVVKNSQHYYTDRGDALTQVIAQWLDTL